MINNLFYVFTLPLAYVVEQLFYFRINSCVLLYHDFLLCPLFSLPNFFLVTFLILFLHMKFTHTFINPLLVFLVIFLILFLSIICLIILFLILEMYSVLKKSIKTINHLCFIIGPFNTRKR